jgi:hypothetical protein
MATSLYRGDPRWISAKYPSKCAHCGHAIARGERAFYYPNGRYLFCKHDDCGGQADRDTYAAIQDEQFYGSGR